ncbi:MAG: hypothetical protein NUV56_02050 [Candidatus Uhrbacteria bacterium]|nr:hypothetical protein [Candidatus Uhrbacteria bacterium]
MKMFSRGASTAGSGVYKTGKKFGFSGGGYNKQGGGDFAKPELFPATCNECGNACEVPFKPNGKKPVYCRDCFKKSEGFETKSYGDKSYGDKKFGDKKFGGSSSYGEKRPSYQAPISKNYDAQFTEINAKLDAILEMLGGE